MTSSMGKEAKGVENAWEAGRPLTPTQPGQVRAAGRGLVSITAATTITAAHFSGGFLNQSTFDLIDEFRPPRRRVAHLASAGRP
jgi:hypothetical protein